MSISAVRFNRWTTRALLVTLMVAVLALAVGPAFADPGPNTSCMGHEASGISPIGSNDEFPGGAPAMKTFVNDKYPGVPTGGIYRIIASLHLGSHEECDAVLLPPE